MAGGFSVTISAVDKASATINAVNKSLSGIAAPVTRMQGALERLGRTTGLNDAATALAGAAQSAASLAAGLAGIGGAASIGGIIALANSTARANQQLGFSATYIGTTADQLARLRGAAELAGVSADALTGGMKGLATTLTDAAGGRNLEALQYFRQLHIEIRNTDGSLRSANDVLPQIADAIANIRDPVLQARVATALLGGSAADLLPLLRQGSAGMRRLADEAGNYNHVTAESQAASERLAGSWAKLEAAGTGFANEITREVSPALSAVETALANVIERNGTWIAQMAGQDLNKWAARAGLLSPEEQARTGTTTGLQFSDLFDAGIAGGALGIWSRAPAMLGGGLASGALGLLRSPLAWPLALHGDTAAGTYNPANPEGLGAPRGIRNNNPLNLGFVPGGGVTGTDGRFGIYNSMPEGIAAAHQQLLRYQGIGVNTLRGIISAWAPPSENDTEGYIAQVSRETGLDPNKPLDMRDPAIASRVMAAMANREVGRGRVTPADIDAGVSRSLGGNGMFDRIGSTPVTLNGSIKADITLNGAPSGTSAITTTTGPVSADTRVVPVFPNGVAP